MKGNSLDNIFHQRMENYESKIAFDNDLLWNKINKQIIPLEKSKAFYQKPTFYFIIGCTVTIITTILVLYFHNNNKSKSPILKLENQELNTYKHEKYLKNDQVIDQNFNIQRKNHLGKKSSSSELNKNIQQKNISNRNSIDSLTILNPIPNIPNQISETKIEVPSVKTQTIEEPKNQQIVKKITVVKKQVIEKDSVVTTKRLRKH